MPFLATLLFGIIQWGFIFASYITLHNAAVIAVRFATLSNPKPGVEQIENVARAAVEPLINGADLRKPTIELDVNVGGVGGAKKVELIYDLTLIVPFVVPQSDGRTLSIQASAVMR